MEHGDGQLDAALRAEIARAAKVLAAGGLVALPTETVYGLGADARNRSAVLRVFAAKRRPADHPLIVHLAGAEHLAEWCSEVPGAASSLAKAFWPGPLTLILQRDSRVLDEVTGGQETIGVRVPAHPVALELLRTFGGGIAAPSANRFGKVSPTTAAHVRGELGDDVDLILDGGACAVGIESTIVDLSGARPRILRPGAVTRAQIEAVLGVELSSVPANASAPRVSGSLASHYAPRTPVRWVDVGAPASAGAREAALLAAVADVRAVGVLALAPLEAAASSAQRDRRVEWRTLPADPVAYAHELYARLRELDELGLESIALEVPPDTPAWEAVRDRLRRAAGLGGGVPEAT
jgi:L-threonylcarbamoyladenylate synthase